MTAAMSHALLQSSEDSPLDLETKSDRKRMQPNGLPAKFSLSQIISPVFLLKAVCQVFLGKGGAIEQSPREGSPERCSDTACSKSSVDDGGWALGKMAAQYCPVYLPK